MLRSFSALLLVLNFFTGELFAQINNWKPVAGKIMSEWALQVDPAKPLNVYPRPQMVRNNWQNLNGLWDYQIVPGKLTKGRAIYDGKILVPYPIESALSGVAKTVGKENTLWYQKTISIDKNMRKKQVLLHFGAVDWHCEVYVNGLKAGEHQGGYDPFSFNITPYLKKGLEQEILVGVWDPTDEGIQPNGKQVNRPNSIWYTPVTGIWQTVWLEGVAATHIAEIKQVADIDNQTISISAAIEGLQAGDELEASAWDGNQQIANEKVSAISSLVIPVKNPKLWSPANPYLYRLKLAVTRKGKVIDEVSSYFAMRKISMAKDAQGIQRMMLNDQFLFQYGPLDQGWWPDGLYTAPTDEALLYDIVQTKAMGFNMIRKHIKVEPARWYYGCDSLGIMVWQDMPSGDIKGSNWDMRPGLNSGRKLDKERSPESEAIYKKEWKAIMDALQTFASIVVWVPFNEAWGQFKTVEITEWTQRYDPTRLVNSASGGNFFPTGHILDVHNYPEPLIPKPSLFGEKQILVLGEFGGLGLPVEGHTWQAKDNWGYQSFKTAEELQKRYQQLMNDLEKLIPMGLSAAVYTQTTDVEIETNGLLTYDRKKVKIPAEALKKMHERLIQLGTK